MQKFVIDADNQVTAYAVAEKAAYATNGDSFANANDLARLAAGWPGTRLVDIWNRLPKVKKVRRFTDRKTAIERIWKVVQNLAPGRARRSASKAPGAGKSPPRANPGEERKPTKTERILALLQRPSGATLQEIMAETNWQPHSVRGFLSQLRKRSGLRLKSFKRGTERAYRIRSKSMLHD